LARVRPKASCHPDKPHNAHGLCRKCYRQSHHVKNREKDLAKNKTYYASKKPAMRAAHKAWYNNNKSTVLARSKEWQRANPDKVIEAQRKWRAANKELVREWMRISYERRKLALGNFTSAQWEARCEYYGWRCAYCKRNDVPITIDHRIPISRGGTHWPSNLVPACRKCNSRKMNKKPNEWKVVA